MAFKLLPNRISKTLPPDAEERARAAYNVLLDLLGPDTPITEDEYRSLRFVAGKRKTIADEYCAEMRTNPTYLEEPPLEEVEKDRRYYEFCDFLESLEQTVKDRRVREQNIAGAEYENGTKSFRKTVEYKAGRSDAKAGQILKKLDKIDKDNAGPSAPKASPPPTTPPAPPAV